MFKLELLSNLDQNVHEMSIVNAATSSAYRITHEKYLNLLFKCSFEDWLIEHLELEDADATFISNSLELWSEYIINNKRENIYD